MENGTHNQMLDAPELTSRIELLRQRTLKLSIIEGCAWSVMWGCGESFVGPFAVFLKADDFQMSLLVTLPLILGAIAQLIGGILVEKLGRRRPLMAITGLIQSLGHIPLFCLPFLFPTHGAAIAVTLGTLLIFSCQVGVPGFTSIMGDLIPEEQRGRYFGKRTALAMLTMLVSMMFSGRILTHFEHQQEIWIGFGIIFAIALLARAYSALLLHRYHEPPFRPSPPQNSISLMDFVREAPHTNFGRFTLAMAIMNGASNISAPFFTQYMLRDLNWTKDQFALTTAVLLLSQFVFLRWWGHICDRHGNRAVILATSLMLPILPILWTLTTNFHLILCAQVLSGMAWSGFNLASNNFIYDCVPADRRHRIFPYYNLINGLFILVGGSVIGAWCAANFPSSYTIGGITIVFLSSLPSVFILSGLLRALIGILLLPQFKEVRKSEPITSSRILWRLSTGEPIFARITEILEVLPRPFASRKKD
ncbi:MAG: MFS transporter [bacterium]